MQLDARDEALGTVGALAEVVREKAIVAGLLLLTSVHVVFALVAPIVQISDYQVYYEDARGFAGLLGPTFKPSVGSFGQKLFYAAFFWAFGDDLRVVGLANAGLSVLAAGCLTLAARCALGMPTARLVPWICTLSLSELYFNNLAGTEVLGSLFVAALFLALVGGADGWRRILVLGVVGGLASWNRSNLLTLGAFVLVVEWFRTGRPRVAVLRALAVQALVMLATLPVAYLNLRTFGHFTPVASRSEENLWYGNNPQASPAGHVYAAIPEQLPLATPERAKLVEAYRSFYVNPDPSVELASLDPVAASQLRARYALGFIRQNPVRYVQLSLGRLQRMFARCTFGSAAYLYYDRRDPAQPRWAPWVRQLILGHSSARRPNGPDLPIPGPMRFTDRWYQLLALLAAGGLVLTAVREGSGFLRGDRGLPFLLAAFYVLPFVLTYAHNRYKVPVMGLMWVYLAHGLVLVGNGVARLRARRS